MNIKENKEFFKKAFIIALPIIIQNFIGSSLNIVDTIMIGKLGELEIAAVGIGNQYFFLYNILVLGTFSAIAIFISQYWGKRDIKNIRKLLGLGIIFAVILASVFTVIALIFPNQIIGIFNKDEEVIRLGAEYLVIVCISYIFTALTSNYATALRSIEKTSIPMFISGIALLINTFLNWVLIFGKLGMPAMGVRGAAIATLIARIVETVLLISYVYLSRSVLAAKAKQLFDIDLQFVKMVVLTMIPVILNEGCWGIGTVMYNVVYGRIGTQAMAAVQIASTVNNLFMVVIFGIASATLVMVGKEVGANNNEKAYTYGKLSIILGCSMGIILSILLIAFSKNIVGIFDVSSDVRIWARDILLVSALAMIIRVYNVIVIVGVLRGGGDAKTSLMIEASTMWFIGVPLAFIGAFVLELPVYLVYALCVTEEVVKSVFCFRRFKSKKWINNLVS